MKRLVWIRIRIQTCLDPPAWPSGYNFTPGLVRQCLYRHSFHCRSYMAYFLVHSLANWLYLSLVTQFRLDTEMSDQNNKWKNSTKIIWSVMCTVVDPDPVGSRTFFRSYKNERATTLKFILIFRSVHSGL